MSPQNSTELFMALFTAALERLDVKEFSISHEELFKSRAQTRIVIDDDVAAQMFRCKVVEG